jgi:hypothetical protein
MSVLRVDEAKLQAALVAEWKRVMNDPATHAEFRGRLFPDVFAALSERVVEAALRSLRP